MWRQWGSKYVAIVLVLTAMTARAAEPEPPGVHLVLFSPSDLAPPPGAVERLQTLAEMTERFFRREMAAWGYPPARWTFFDREPDGTTPRILVLRGKSSQASGRYHQPDFAPEVIAGATATFGFPGKNDLWWIFVYLGDRPIRFNDYRGHGDVAQGGWALVNYDSIPGTLDPSAPLASPFHAEFTVKGCIQMLGYALGLPRIGPNPRLRLGNTLMGPTTAWYHSRLELATHDERVYLSPASAAMLWKHPVFSGRSDGRGTIPAVSWHDLKATYRRTQDEIVLTGKLVASARAHSIVVIDDTERNADSFWSRSYVTKPDPDGTFRIVLDDPVMVNGQLRLLACFDNGTITGNGRGHGNASARLLPYRPVLRELRF